jgi:hypothetical protein
LSAWALNKWYHREFDLTKAAGYRFIKWSLAYEGEKAGTFYTRFKEVYILDKNGKVKATLFKDKITLANSSNIEKGAQGYTDISKSIYDPRSHLTASFKYLFNAIRWVSKASMVEAGIKKILILGDASGTANYRIKGTDPNGFFTSLTNLCTAVGYTPTFKDAADYGGSLNATLAEMNQYDCVLVMGSASAGQALISTSMIADIQTYRKGGGGIILITDHGPVLTDISQAYPPQGTNMFFATVNAIAVNFGAYFSGNYDRTPVNVGFLRSTYGDHPLYDGMLDSENVAAGGSESKVVVAQYPKYTAGNAPIVDLSQDGRHVIRALVVLKDGTIELLSFVYSIRTGSPLVWQDRLLNEITALNIGAANTGDFHALVDGAGLGTLVGQILLNGRKIGELLYTDATGSVETWYGGSSSSVRLTNGDVLRAQIDSPFSYYRDLPVTRFQPDLSKVLHPGRMAGLLKAGFPGPAVSTVHRAAKAIATLSASPSVARDMKIIRDFMADKQELPGLPAYVYSSNAAAQEAMTRVIPPTPKAIFDTWDRFDADKYWPNGSAYTGEVASWAWDEAKQSAVMPLNTATMVGFVSKESVESYEHDVVVQSTNADDDVIAICLAVVNDVANSQVHTLNLVVQQGGWALVGSPLASHCIEVDTNQAGRRKRVTQNNFAGVNSNSSGGTGWSGRYSRCYIRRQGNKFTILASKWNSLVLDPTSLMEFTLDDKPELAQFKGPQKYGYGAFSQAASFFSNIKFVGGLLQNTVIDASTNQVYRYVVGTGWTLVSGIKAQDVFSAPRKLTAAEGGAVYLLNADGTITAQ